MTTMSFPDEILAEILSWLPVISLLRFKCVSRSWLSVIDSSNFVSLHLKRSIQENPQILYPTYEDTYSIDYENTLVPKPYDFPMNDQTIIGTCNGIVCLTDKEFYMALWNPATKEYLDVPYSSVEESLMEDEREVVVGFGYDSIADKYKVVRSVFFYRDTQQHKEFAHVSEVKVCTLGSKEWRRIENPPCECLYNRHLVPQVNGCLHWLGASPICIISFDVADEVFRNVPLMVGGVDDASEITPGDLRGCLSTLIHRKGNTRIDVWLMNEYGVKESWAKQFAIQIPLVSSGQEFTSIEPLVMRKKDNTIVLKCEGQIYLCNTWDDTFAVHCICDDPYSCYTAHLYAESLVSIATLTGNKGQE